MRYVFLLFFSLISCNKADYIYSMVYEYNTNYAERYVYCIYKYAFMYDLPPELLARQIREETHFNRLKISHKGAHGCSQIRPFDWEHLLYRIDDGKLGKHIISNNITDTRRYYHRIGYSIEMQAIIMRSYLDTYDSYEMALLNYHMSRNSKYYWKLRNGTIPIMSCKYISNIIMGE